jgi:high affinity cGMP-specific 3',5'-cyclic phosphodiesterase 9
VDKISLDLTLSVILRWMRKEVNMRTSLFGDWNSRTQVAQKKLTELCGESEQEEVFTAMDEYSVDFVQSKELVWELDPFKLSDKFQMSSVLQMFEALGLISKFAIPLPNLTAFVVKCRDSYRKDNAFHNWFHAWSVTHVAYMILSSTSARQILKAKEVLAVMISCLVHDVQHPGVNSDFLIKSGSDLALKFPYKNVLEQMHWFTAQQLFKEKVRTNILVNVSPGEAQEILALVHEGIMATDMANHKSIVDSLAPPPRTPSEQEGEASGSGCTAPAPVVGDKSAVEGASHVALDKQNDGDRLKLIKAIVHAADLSGQALEKDTAYCFGRGVLTEFHLQSQHERMEKLPATPFMQNLHQPLAQAKAQLGFLNFVVEPLWSNLCMVFPEIKHRHQAVRDRMSELDFDHLDQWGGVCEGLVPPPDEE